MHEVFLGIVMKIRQLIIRASLTFLFGIFSINLVNAETISSPLFDYMDDKHKYRKGLELQGFPLLSQRDPAIYADASFMQVKDSVSNTSNASAPVEKMACLATVYVMLTRGSSNKNATVEDFYADPRKHNGNGPGAKAPTTIGAETSVDLDQIIQSLRKGEPVILHGVGGILENHFVLVTGYRKPIIGRIQLIAHDPWPISGDNKNGTQIYIKGSKRKLKHPEFKDVVFTGMRSSGVFTDSFLAYNTNEPPCAIKLDQSIAYLGTCSGGYANGDAYVLDRSGGLMHGAKSELTYEDGLGQGPARVLSKDGSYFEGNLLNSEYEGHGKITLADGSVYEGEFLKHARHGPGTLTLASGKSHDQVWEHGHLVSGYDPSPKPTHGSSQRRNIADDFFENSAQAIKKYSTWSTIEITVRSISVSDGKVGFKDIQIPHAITQQAEALQNEPFSWDKFGSVAVGGNNVYEQQYTVICTVSLEVYGEMTVQEGRPLVIQAKLVDFSGKTLVFECK